MLNFKSVNGMAQAWHVLLFVCCFAVTLEIAVRLDQKAKYGVSVLDRYSYDAVLYTVDEYGVRGQPNATFEKWHLNSLGFRGPDMALRKSPGKIRIACIGASETFGLFEQAGNEWPRQLERVLREKGLEVEVLNAALAGMSLSQRILHFQNRIVPLKPDVVIMMLEYTSYAGLTPAKLEARRAARTVPFNPGRGGLSESIKSLRVLGAIKYSVIPKLPPAFQQAYSDLELYNKVKLRERELGPQFRSFRQVNDIEIDAFREDIRHLYDLAARHGVHLILASPAFWLSERNILIFYTNWPYIDESWLRQATTIFPNIAKDLAGQSNIPFIDLGQVIVNRESLLMKDMVHYSDEGAKSVGDAIAKMAEELPVNLRISLATLRQP